MYQTGRLASLYVGGTPMHHNHSLEHLSLTARLAIALHCFERYSHAHQLTAPEITVFLEYLWEFPILDGPLAFRAWEGRQPELVTVGLGADFPVAYLVWLGAAGISTDEFRQLLEHTVEIVYSSFYGAADDRSSLMDLQQVLTITKQTDSIAALLPLVARSRFADRQGWGHRLSESERNAWRVL